MLRIKDLGLGSATSRSRPASAPSALQGKHESVRQVIQVQRTAGTHLPSSVRVSPSFSPELVFDRHRDYILYAVDHEETYRASLAIRSPGALANSPIRFPTSENATTTPKQSHSHSSLHGSSSQRSPQKSFLVGKGFFSWGLEEAGDGESTVVGRVRAESGGRGGIAGSDDEEGDAGEVLEVVLRMKETQPRSKDQYYEVVRAFNAGANAAASRADASSEAGNVDDVFTSTPVSSSSQAKKKQRLFEPPPVAPSPMATSAEATNLAAGQALLRQLGMLPPAQPQGEASAQTNAQQQSQLRGQHAQLLQLLQLLQAQQQQQQPQQGQQIQHQQPMSTSDDARPSRQGQNTTSCAPPDEQRATQHQAQRASGSKRPALSSSRSAPSQEITATASRSGAATAETPASAYTPAADTPCSETSPAPDTSAAPGSASNAVSAEPKVRCANCGATKVKYWRRLANPSAGTTPSVDDETGLPIEPEKLRLCNPCGLWHSKYGYHRPDTVYDKDARERERERLRQAEAEEGRRKRRGKEREETAAMETATKKAKLDASGGSNAGEERLGVHWANWAQENGNGAAGAAAALLGSISAASTPATEGSKGASNENASTSERSIARTLSEVCVRDASRQKAKQAKRGPGRPKGVKNGDGQKLRRRPEKGAMGAAGGKPVGASSPVFRAPLPPANRHVATSQPPAGGQAGAGTKELYAQSSPVRPSMSARATFPGAAGPCAASDGPEASPSRRLRYGAPRYLLDSSPSTALDTLLSESDLDFDGFDLSTVDFSGLMPGAVPGPPGSPTPGRRNTNSLVPRRSPRKLPNGTIGPHNPYASANINTSPTATSSASASRRAAAARLGLPMGSPTLDRIASSSSPMTRGRMRSSTGAASDNLWSSGLGSGKRTGNGKGSSSAYTAPTSLSRSPSPSPSPVGSPSPSPGRRSDRLRKGPLPSSGKKSASTTTERQHVLQRGPFRRVESNVSRIGPYVPDGDGKAGATPTMGLGETPAPSSPTLGASAGRFRRAQAQVIADLDLPPSSPPMFDDPSPSHVGASHGESGAIGKGADAEDVAELSMREFFRTPSEWTEMSESSPEWIEGVAEGREGKTGKTGSNVHLKNSAEDITANSAHANVTGGGGDESMALVPSGAYAATSEYDDMRSSCDGSPEEDLEAPLGWELFSDPDNLLGSCNLFGALPNLPSTEAASGSGSFNHANGSNGVGMPDGTGLSPATFGEIFAQGFAAIELHNQMEFGDHLALFTAQGSMGVAATIADAGKEGVAPAPGSASASVSEVAPAPVTARDAADAASQKGIQAHSTSVSTTRGPVTASVPALAPAMVDAALKSIGAPMSMSPTETASGLPYCTAVTAAQPAPTSVEQTSSALQSLSALPTSSTSTDGKAAAASNTSTTAGAGPSASEAAAGAAALFASLGADGAQLAALLRDPSMRAFLEAQALAQAQILGASASASASVSQSQSQAQNGDQEQGQNAAAAAVGGRENK